MRKLRGKQEAKLAANRAEELRVQEVRRKAFESLAERAATIEEFERAASSVCYRDGRFDVTEYADSVIEGLSARIYVCRRTSRFAYRDWFLKRPWGGVLKLRCHDHPTNAREVARFLL